MFNLSQDVISSQETSTLDCGHIFHSKCIRKSLRHSTACPMCRDDRFNVKGEEIEEMYNSEEELSSSIFRGRDRNDRRQICFRQGRFKSYLSILTESSAKSYTSGI